ncbi:MAG: hypothetical protein M2R45_00638 [Verrucomicrobia subdivision 3 bacterium]|nr:hypothetical protein [Limisphaerales bacterium]MCS1414479.1 hypothetical protein [Limisphaerales bacterium]
MNAHIRGSITRQLRLQQIDILAAQEDSTAQLPENELLDQAIRLNRALVSQSDGLTTEASRPRGAVVPFPSVIYAHQLCITIRQFVQDPDLTAKAGEPEVFHNQVEYRPL